MPWEALMIIVRFLATTASAQDLSGIEIQGPATQGLVYSTHKTIS